MNTEVNAEYLRGIVENDFTVLQQIYKESLPEVIRHIKKNSGTLEDAKDVFQEGILVIFKKVSNDSLNLTTHFHIYLFSVCRRIWLKKLNKRMPVTASDGQLEDYSIEDELEANQLKTRKWVLFNKHFDHLSEECRKVLKMLFNGNSGKEIASTMGYSEEYAKRKKYKCKISLSDRIKSDPEYQTLSH